ncbi:GvpL/GvpF family gas vesicle protein [Rhodoflexus caldus]|uniref:GvpL/GvpF family gas vesicle protein n=1 Tax=Rhodoflexus caldus TaxID=2891236 RepID=UPI002029C2AA|nr:GvpL/GvpF family gas vesicle protein [Rhodoflexus caldus]
MSQHSHIYVYGIAESAFPLHDFHGKVELITACYEAVEVPLYLIVGRIAAIKQGIDTALHQDVLLQAGRYTSVVPVPPGIIFNSSENLFKQLMSVAPQVAEKISFFRGKHCWRVALYLADEFAFCTAIKHPELEQIDLKSLTAAPAQVQQLRKKRDEICRRLMPYESSALVSNLVQQLEGVFSYVRNIPLLNGAHSGRTDLMIGHFAMLVPQTKAEKLGLLLQAARNELHPKGVHLELSGPWPPYFFMD